MALARGVLGRVMEIRVGLFKAHDWSLEEAGNGTGFAAEGAAAPHPTCAV